MQIPTIYFNQILKSINKGQYNPFLKYLSEDDIS